MAAQAMLQEAVLSACTSCKQEMRLAGPKIWGTLYTLSI